MVTGYSEAHLSPFPAEFCDKEEANSDTTHNARWTGFALLFCGDGVMDAVEICDDGPSMGNQDSAQRIVAFLRLLSVLLASFVAVRRNGTNGVGERGLSSYVVMPR